MLSHAQDWDDTDSTLAAGTKRWSRVQHSKLKIKYICGGMNHYPHVHRCRKPEYVRNEDLFPRVWNKLYEGLKHPERITVGLRTLIDQLKHSDEQAGLRTAETRLTMIEQKLLRYAEQRSEDQITATQQRELSAPLLEEQQTLLEEKANLQAGTQRIHEARELLAYVEPVARRLFAWLGDLTDYEKAIVIRAACQRVRVYGANEIEIEFSLPGLEAFVANGLPEDPQGTTASPPARITTFRRFSNGVIGHGHRLRHWDLSNMARCRPC